MGKGSNLLNIKCILGSLSDETQIIDYWAYDDASIDKSSNYTYIRQPSSVLVHSDGYYQFNNYSMVQESNPVQLKLAEFTSNDFEVNIDVYFTGSSTPKQMTLQVRESTLNIDSRSECGTWSSSKTCGTLVNGTNYRTNPSGALSNNVWYTFKVVRQNNNITCKILNGTSSVVEKTSVGWTDNPVLTFIQFSGYIGTLRWKNLKIQLL